MTLLFSTGSIRATELAASDVTALQAFFEANPEYFLTVGDAPPLPSAAREEFEDLPPADIPFSGRWLIGFHDSAGSMIGFAGVLSDLLARHVWHIGIFIVATRLHGTGVATSLYHALEGWMKLHGAQWVRLGVVEGNAKAERFWHKLGYVEVRKRSGVTMGKRSNTVRVLFKALGGGTLAQYLSLVPRDHPESTLR